LNIPYVIGTEIFYTVNHETPDVFLADSCSMLKNHFVSVWNLYALNAFTVVISLINLF